MTKERAAKIILDLINAGEAEYRNFSVEEITAFKKAYVALNPEPVTNADRIRSLSDEELAEWLAILTDCMDCPCRDPYDQCDTVDGSCKKQWLNWLKEEDGE